MGNKTKVGLLLVAALIFVIAAPALAASPAAEVATVTDVDGAAVEVTTSTDVPAEIVESATEVLGENTATQTVTVMDIAISGGKPPYKITIPMAGVTSAKVYHYENGEWALLPTSIENGEIVAWTNSASPFAVVASTVEGAVVEQAPGTIAASVTIPDTTTTALGTFITLPAGATYYTMVEGAPGKAHTLNKATQVQVIERLNNGYTKILMNNMTYLIKTSGGAVTTTTGKSPKTGAESDMAMMLLIAGAALASVAVFAGRKALKAQD